MKYNNNEIRAKVVFIWLCIDEKRPYIEDIYIQGGCWCDDKFSAIVIKKKELNRYRSVMCVVFRLKYTFFFHLTIFQYILGLLKIFRSHTTFWLEIFFTPQKYILTDTKKKLYTIFHPKHKIFMYQFFFIYFYICFNYAFVDQFLVSQDKTKKNILDVYKGRTAKTKVIYK